MSKDRSNRFLYFEYREIGSVSMVHCKQTLEMISRKVSSPMNMDSVNEEIRDLFSQGKWAVRDLKTTIREF